MRRAGLAVAREVEARAPELATSRWWKEERHGVFIDYNQNAKDRTTVGGYSVRPTPGRPRLHRAVLARGRRLRPGRYTLLTVPARFAELGDPWAGIEDTAEDLTPLLELAEAQADAGLRDEPPPPRDDDSDSRPGAGPARRGSGARSPRRASSRAPDGTAPTDEAVPTEPRGRPD